MPDEVLIAYGFLCVVAADPRLAYEGAPMYSTFLADNLGMHKPYVQYVLYGGTLAGCVSVAKRFLKAYNMVKHVHLSAQPACQKEAQHAAYMANCHPWELDRAGRVVARFRAGQPAAAFAFPALWIAWRAFSQLHQVSRSAKHDSRS